MSQIKLQNVVGLEWAGGTLNTIALIDGERFEPLLAPTLWLLDLAKSGSSENTLRTYATSLKQFLMVATSVGDADVMWKDITDREMSAYIRAYLLQKRGLKSRSIEVHIAALDSFYSWSYQHGFIEFNPLFSYTYEAIVDFEDEEAQQCGKTKREIRLLHQTYLDEDEFKRLLESVEFNDGFINERNCLTLKLGYYAGFRASETIQDRYLDTRRLRSVFENSKDGAAVDVRIKGKGNKLRVVNFPPKLVEDVKSYLFGRRATIKDGPLICNKDGGPLNRKFASSLFRECADSIGEAAWKKRTYHVLRKCYATNLVTWCIEHGLSEWVLVPERLGHSDVETTKIYIFFEALLNSRLRKIEELSLKNTRFRNIWGKSNK